MNTGFPNLIKVEQFAKDANLSRTQAYGVVAKMPDGVKVRLGGRVRLNEDKLKEWIEQGGNVAK